MKLFIFLIFFIFLSGCREGKEAVSEADKIVKDYSKGLVKAPEKTRIITEISTIRRSLELHKIEYGKYPESISDLPIKIKDPEEYKYDREKGEVKSKHYPEL